MKAISSLSWLKTPASVVLISVVASTVLGAAGRDVLSVRGPGTASAKRGSTTEVPVRAELTPGYHVNSSTPADEYLIPLRLTWSAEPLKVVGVEYPEPKFESYQFSEKPLSVYLDDFDIVTKLSVPADAPTGLRTLTGKLRYQACSDKLCLPPRTATVRVDLDIK